MQYAYQRAEGFVMITGRPGTGKSTLVNDLIAAISGTKVDVAKLVCTQLEADDLLHMVAHDFKINTAGEAKSTILQKLKQKLVSNYNDGRRSLLIIDEAQALSKSALEELRLLTNLQINNQPLLQIFLLGQDELRSLVQEPGMEQVHQRLVAACHLEPLKEDETKHYILHRLAQVGYKRNPAISEAVFPVVYKFSIGIPRRINLICSRLFLHGAVEELARIGIKDAKVVISELQNEQLSASNVHTDMDFTADDTFDSDAEDDKNKASTRVATTAEAARESALKKLTGATDPSTAIPRGTSTAKAEFAPEVSIDSLTVEQRSDASRRGRATFNVDDSEIDKQPYRGPERRRQIRRKAQDRRDSIRFEPGKEDRRKNQGRRKSDIEGAIWDQLNADIDRRLKK